MASNPITSWDKKTVAFGAMMVLVTAMTSHFWYLNQKSDAMRLIYDLGLTRTSFVLMLMWCGLALFYVMFRLVYQNHASVSRGTWLLIFSVYACFSIFWLFGRSASFYTWFGFRPPSGGLYGLAPFFFFVASSLVLRCLIPLGFTCFLFRRSASEIGYRTDGVLKGAWIYTLLTAFIIALVIFYAAEQPAFIKKYPWCKTAIEGGQISGWVFLVYALSLFVFFLSGESFWRGYLLLGASRELGPIVLFLMVNIYVFSHFGKPLPETMGAIVAGIVLGLLALKHQTFLPGVICHWSVAMAMDLCALSKRGIQWIW